MGKSYFRLVRGNPRVVGLPKLAADNILQSGFIFWDAAEKAARPTTVLVGTPAANRVKVAETLVGFSMSRLRPGTEGRYGVATAGQWIVDTPAGWSGDPLDPVAIGDDLASVVAAPNETLTIGRLASAKAAGQTTCVIELLSRMSQHNAPTVEEEAAPSESPSPSEEPLGSVSPSPSGPE